MKTSTDDSQTQLLKLGRYAARSGGVAASKRDAAIREAHRRLEAGHVQGKLVLRVG